jgi:hypothetical protein
MLPVTGIVWGLLLLLTAGGCEQALTPQPPENKPVKNFEHFWRAVDRHYSFFQIKGVDWDSVYQVYRPRVHNDMSNQALLRVMDSCLRLLQDGHNSLDAGFRQIKYPNFYLDSPANFDQSVLEREYFYASGRNERTAGFAHTVLDSIGYVRYKDFTASFAPEQLDYVLERMQPYEGLILDLRNNTGGAVSNVYDLLARFMRQERTVLQIQHKNGRAHDAFTAPEDVTVAPAGDVQYTRPVVVLTNRQCYSATSFFAGACKAVPHITLLGDTTGGGGGAPAKVELPNGWVVSCSSTRVLTAGGLNIEPGVPPDTSVSMTEADAAAGRDPLIEAAIQRLRE